ncbi:MAG: response regulator [Pyrinomonadaceae bacterium]
MTKPKLLLADDSVTIRKVVELTFADEGIDVSTVADAEMAMQRFVEIQPDIVLVDVGLDGTNGYRICEMIKADNATKHIPVLLLVGSFEPFDHDEAERVKADGFLTKPFHSIRDLVTRVQGLLGRQPAAGPASEVEPPPVPIFGGEFTDDMPVTDEPESDDIEDLYRSSFAETVEIEEFDTVDDLLGDSGMDDEMIETNRVSSPDHSFADLSADDQPNGEIKEFDWSPESVVAGTVQAESPEPAFEPLAESEIDSSENAAEPQIAESVAEDEELLWLAETGRESEVHAVGDAESMETIEISHAPDLIGTVGRSPAESPKVEADDDVQLFDDIDFTKPNDAATEPQRGPEAAEDEEPTEDVDPSIHDTIPYEPGEQPPVPAVEPEPEYFSPELIDRIAQRVIERLSDSVVREVAKEEVPRIAEKLIREALEQEKAD